MPGLASEVARRVRTKARYRADHGPGDHCASLRAFERELFVTIDDRPGLEQHGRPRRLPQYPQVVVTIDARLGVHELMLITPHEFLGVLRRVAKPACLQLQAE